MDIAQIKRRLRETGRTQAGLAKALGVAAAGVSRMLNGQRELKAKEVPIIEAYLSGETPPLQNEASQAPGEFPEATQEQDGTLPIYASAQDGLDGGIILTYREIERRAMPEPLKGVNNGFGFYIIGDSMYPRFKEGELMLVHPTKPARPGDDVVVVLSDHGDNSYKVIVRELLSRTSQELGLLRFNPRESIHIPIENVLSVYLIVGTYTGRS